MPRENAIGETTYSCGHNSHFALPGKLGVSMSTDNDRDFSVVAYARSMMDNDKMGTGGQIASKGCVPCYRCGYGHR